MKKIDKRIVKTRQNIMNSFMVLLEKKEFEQISIAELARHAQIDRKTFYLHYNNTADLIRQFEQDQLEIVKNAIRIHNRLDIDYFLDTLNGVLENNKSFYRLISQTGRNSFFLDRCEDMVAESLKYSIGLNEQVAISVNIHIKFIASGVVSSYMDWLKGDSDLELDVFKGIVKDILNRNLKQYLI